MMKKSKYTKKSSKTLWILRTIDFLLLFAPLLVYIILALGSPIVGTAQKITVVGTVAIAAIVCVFNLLLQKHLRCPIWIIFLGLYFAIDQLMPLMLMIAGASILDEFMFAPLISYYKTKTIANKTIDARGL